MTPPRSNLTPPAPRWALASVFVAIVGLALLAARARAGEAEPGSAGGDAGQPTSALAAAGSAGVEGAAASGAAAGHARLETAEPDDDGDSLEATGEGEGEEATAAIPSFDSLRPIPKESDFLSLARAEDSRLVVDSAAGTRTLTVVPAFQQKLTELLRSYAMPYGALAAIEPATGKVLALAEFSKDNPSMRGLPLKAIFPAASVFKVVTGAALLANGVTPEEKVCFHGGRRRIQERLLEDDSRRDNFCVSLTEAMGHSANVVFAKLAKNVLDAQELRGWADRLGFNSTWSFDEPMDVSLAKVPADEFGLATTAAGFGEVFLSPLHGALLAGAVGNRGVMVSPILFEDETGKPRKVLEPATASMLSDMMETTVTAGTARRAFRERGRYALGEVRCAGKTGSISDKKPFRDFSWFVGFAPKENPKIAVAAVVVNGTLWRVKAPYLAREALRMYLEPPKSTPKKKTTVTGGRSSLARRPN